MKNQLFSKIPDTKIVLTLLHLFGIQGLDDNHSFTKEHLKELKTVENIQKICGILSDYYLPCKASIYLRDINEKKSITILRQFLKVHKYTLYSKEKYSKGDKMLHYQVIPMDISINIKSHDEKRVNPIVISFD